MSIDVRAIRRDMRLTQQELADRINDVVPGMAVTQQLVGRWESGDRNPSDVVLRALRVIAPPPRPIRWTTTARRDLDRIPYRYRGIHPAQLITDAVTDIAWGECVGDPLGPPRDPDTLDARVIAVDTSAGAYHVVYFDHDPLTVWYLIREGRDPASYARQRHVALKHIADE